jgi:hypothetical protein
MAKQPVKDPRVRIPGPGEEPKQVSREVRCLSNDVFPKEGFVHLLKNTLPSSMLEISTVLRKIRL